MSEPEPDKWPEVDPTPDVGGIDDLDKLARQTADDAIGDDHNSEGEPDETDGHTTTNREDR